MRAAFLAIILAATVSQATATPKELLTGDNAILCLSASSLPEASRPPNSQQRLRSLSCVRMIPGVPLTVLEGDSVDGPWKISLRPQGISGGVTFYGFPSSFALPDGKPVGQTRRAAR